MQDKINPNLQHTHQASISNLYQDFVINLAPQSLLATMANYGLKAGDISKFYALNEDGLRHLSKDIQASGLYLLENISEALVAWPKEVNWPLFNQAINQLLKAWLSDYKNGASIESALQLLNCLELHGCLSTLPMGSAPSLS